MATLHPRHMMLFGAGTWLLSSLAVNTRFGLFSRRTLTAFGAHEACASRCTVSDKFDIALRERINHLGFSLAQSWQTSRVLLLPVLLAPVAVLNVASRDEHGYSSVRISSSKAKRSQNHSSRITRTISMCYLSHDTCSIPMACIPRCHLDAGIIVYRKPYQATLDGRFDIPRLFPYILDQCATLITDQGNTARVLVP